MIFGFKKSRSVKSEPRLLDHGSQPRLFDQVSQIKQLNVAGNRWFIAGLIKGGDFNRKVYRLEVPHMYVKKKVDNAFKAYLAVYSAEIKPLAFYIPKGGATIDFNRIFPHDEIMDAANSHDLLVKNLGDYNVNGNRWFIYVHEEKKVYKADFDGVISSMVIMSLGAQFSIAVYTKDFKHIRSFTHPDLALEGLDLMAIFGAGIASYIEYEGVSEGFDSLGNIF